MCGVNKIDRIINEEIRGRVEMHYKLSGIVENSVLRWFEHAERMNDDGMAKRVYDSGENAGGDQRQSGWME